MLLVVKLETWLWRESAAISRARGHRRQLFAVSELAATGGTTTTATGVAGAERSRTAPSSREAGGKARNRLFALLHCV